MVMSAKSLHSNGMHASTWARTRGIKSLGAHPGRRGLLQNATGRAGGESGHQGERPPVVALPTAERLEREILDLRFSQGLSYAEIAEALDIPVGTVRSRLHHAVAEVRTRLDSEENISPSKL